MPARADGVGDSVRLAAMSFFNFAGARRIVALVVVVACARIPSVRGVGLTPDYRR